MVCVVYKRSIYELEWAMSIGLNWWFQYYVEIEPNHPISCYLFWPRQTLLESIWSIKLFKSLSALKYHISFVLLRLQFFLSALSWLFISNATKIEDFHIFLISYSLHRIGTVGLIFGKWLTHILLDWPIHDVGLVSNSCLNVILVNTAWLESYHFHPNFPKKHVGHMQVAFIPYITAGDPDLSTTAEAMKVLDSCGSDIIELGVPYSDPLADGPVIQVGICHYFFL